MPWLDSTVRSRLKILLNLPKSIPMVWNLVWDRRIELWKKVVFVGGPLAYFFFPVDFISDFIPILGQVDDLTVMFLMVERFIALCPDHIIRQYWRQ